MSYTQETIPLSTLQKSLLRDYPIYEFNAIYADGLTRLDDRSASLYSWKSDHVFKLRGTKYEMNMIHLAGDCAVPVVGQVVRKGEQLGFIMRRETTLATPSKSSVEMMKGVVESLHSKGIIHGDIKLCHMLLCSDGKVRLCDFAGAFLKEHSSEAPRVYTISYLSPYRALHLGGPWTVEDDLFALGVSIWELFSSKTPFHGLKLGAIRESIRRGTLINVSEIEDDDIVRIIAGLMNAMLSMQDKGDIIS
jgi:serine/threonine protein kinase